VGEATLAYMRFAGTVLWRKVRQTISISLSVALLFSIPVVEGVRADSFDAFAIKENSCAEAARMRASKNVVTVDVSKK
jgi:hypothetical protein